MILVMPLLTIFSRLCVDQERQCKIRECSILPGPAPSLVPRNLTTRIDFCTKRGQARPHKSNYFPSKVNKSNRT